MMHTVFRQGWQCLQLPNRLATLSRRSMHTSPPRHDMLSKQSHWYRLQDGDACHFVPMRSNPSKKRAPTTNDARLLGLVPSVTTVLGIVHSQTLQAWNLREMMFAAWRLVLDTEGPRRVAELPKKALPDKPQGAAGGEGKEGQEKQVEEEIEVAVVEDTAGIQLEDINVEKMVDEVEVKQTRTWDLGVFAARITKLYLEKISEAPNKGKAFHVVIEDHLLALVNQAQPKPWPERYRVYQQVFEEWVEENVAEVMLVEQSFGCVYGFGGKCDAMFRLKDGTVAICDFKTQLATDGKFKKYPSWAAQLVAYAVGLGYPEARLLNMCFALGNTVAFEVKYWDGGEEVNLDDIVDTMKSEAAERDGSGKGQLLWTSKETEDTVFSEINRGYWEQFSLAFKLWCSPLGKSFVPHESLKECKPFPTWDELLALGTERPLRLTLPPQQEAPQKSQ